MNIGVLALQGDFREHEDMLRSLGAKVTQVRLPRDLEGLDGLIIPGGESTTIGKLAVSYDLLEPLRAFAGTHAVWGTCAGMILLARDTGRDQPLIGAMDIAVARNAFGRQVDSFETDLEIPALAAVGAVAAEPPAPFHAVFIRAPLIAATGPDVEVLARLPDGRTVAARQGGLMATAFHPELTGDARLHELFLQMVKDQLAKGQLAAGA
jgi:5'-phosphate synthase pdxT subunit